MASAPDSRPDSPPEGPSEAPDQLSPGNGETRENVESPPDEGGATEVGTGDRKSAADADE